MPTKKAKTTPKKPTKKRATKYDDKLVINGSFEDLVKELIIPANKTTPKK